MCLGVEGEDLKVLVRRMGDCRNKSTIDHLDDESTGILVFCTVWGKTIKCMNDSERVYRTPRVQVGRYNEVSLR